MTVFFIFSMLGILYVPISPGDSIGVTYRDYQPSGQRILVDDYTQAHIVWDGQQSVLWDVGFLDPPYGGTQVSSTGSSYGQLDITRDANPDDQRTVVCYQYDPGTGYCSWIDIDAGNCWGNWPNNPKSISGVDDLWPMIANANNNNIIVVTRHDFASPQPSYIRCGLTTDQGASWTLIADIDSSGTNSHFVRSSHNSGSNKVVIAWTQHISDSAYQLDNDVYYMLSTDNGETWGPHTNITNYQPYPLDSVRAYANVNAAFDKDDNLHIVWGGRRVVNGDYYEASKIFHWDDLNNTITVVSSPSVYYSEPGGWWKTEPGAGDFGAWRMPADYPQLVADPNEDIYCLWHGNDDYNDYSANGYINGEVYGAYSTDNGLTWFDYVNLTNTRSPGAPAGSCYDEDYMTANPFIVNDSVWVTYIEDKDAGAYAQGEGIMTSNSVFCWVFSKYLIGTSVEEEKSLKPEHFASMLNVFPNPFKQMTDIRYQITEYQRQEPRGKKQDISLKIYNISGRVVQQFGNKTIRLSDHISWHGTDIRGHKVPAGVYFVHLKTENKSITAKVIKLR